MQKQVSLKLLPSEAADHNTVLKYAAATAGIPKEDATGCIILKQSIDARSRSQVWVSLTVNLFVNEPPSLQRIVPVLFPDISAAKKTAIIIGAGPAGLFAALQLIELGIKPIILERGKDVRSRRRDLAAMNKEGIVNPESNYCFGEGGAGTYSDGKLYTRSNKRGDINRILQLFVQFGAPEKIIYQSHPHIGTNKLPQIITAMREQILASGGVFLFEEKLVDFKIESDKIKHIITQKGNTYAADAYILATGHSARDIFELLHAKKILIEAKPFALGVRIEHPQSLIDSCQYHTAIKDEFLPPAAYSLVEQVNSRGVFSFCMCPGGIIAPAATAPGEIVVNGWSPSKRNNPYANSGMVTSIELSDTASLNLINRASPLVLMAYQQMVEQKAFAVGGGSLKAPAQRMVDFCNNKTSLNLPDCSYLPGLTGATLQAVLPKMVYQNLQIAFKAFGKKMKGYYTNDAVVVATESRTSSPVRIPRDNETLQHLQIKNLYPCGEGAGYAGGIVSAAMDGQKIARQLKLVL